VYEVESVLDTQRTAQHPGLHVQGGGLMPFEAKASLIGLKQVLDRLDKLEGKVRKKTLRAGVDAGSKLVSVGCQGPGPEGYRVAPQESRPEGQDLPEHRSRGGDHRPSEGVQANWLIRNGKEVVSDPVRYAHLAERGTSRMAARPFLGPALDATREQCVQTLTNVIGNALEDAGTGGA
jgi:HK97 gp10 family phage protein